MVTETYALILKHLSSLNPYLNILQLNTDLFSLLLKLAVETYRGPKYVYYYDHRNKESFDKFYGKPTEEMG